MKNKKNLILKSLGILSKRNLSFSNTINFYDARIKQFLIKRRFMENQLQYGFVCWGQCTNLLENNKIYKKIYVEIKIIKDTKLLKKNFKHYCIFDINEIKEFLDIISSEYEGVSFKIKKDSNLSFTSSDGYTLYLEMKKTNRIKLLWILCLVRHIYEFPFNVFLRDALKLKSMPKFEDQHISNLLQLVASTAYDCRYSYEQSLGFRFRKSVDLLTLKQRLSKSRQITLIYKNQIDIHNISRDFLLPAYIEEQQQRYDISSFGYWFNSGSWQRERLNVYERYYEEVFKKYR